MRLRPAFWNSWYTDATVTLAAFIALGALGAVIGAAVDRRLRRA
jgi:hypothetical protein